LRISRSNKKNTCFGSYNCAYSYNICHRNQS
jgi:hypothetical protein